MLEGQHLRVITDATGEPVSLDDVRTHLRLESTEDDYLLSIYIKAARMYAENYTKRSFMPQTFELRIDEFPDGEIIELPRPPLSSATTDVVITYLDASSGNSTTLNSTYYTVDTHSEPGRVILNYNSIWPDEYDMPQAVRVQYKAGYHYISESTGGTVPEAIKYWIMLRTAQMYEHREPILIGRDAAIVDLPRSFVDGLLDQYCIIEVV